MILSVTPISGDASLAIKCSPWPTPITNGLPSRAATSTPGYSRNMIAKPLRCKTAILAQVKQDVDNREDKRPQANDLKDSAGGEEAADEVVMLYRQEFYDAKKEARAERSPSSAEVLIRKNRNGPLGKVELGWIGPQTRFTNT